MQQQCAKKKQMGTYCTHEKQKLPCTYSWLWCGKEGDLCLPVLIYSSQYKVLQYILLSEFKITDHQMASHPPGFPSWPQHMFLSFLPAFILASFTCWPDSWVWLRFFLFILLLLLRLLFWLLNFIFTDLKDEGGKKEWGLLFKKRTTFLDYSPPSASDILRTTWNKLITG